MEIVSQHELLDVLRVEQGIILEVHKHKMIDGWIYSSDYKNKATKVKGIRNCYQVKERFESRGTVFEVGDYILRDFKTIALKDTNDFTIELKSSGGSILKSLDGMERLFKKIQDYIDNNY